MKEWQDYSRTLQDLLGLTSYPVAINYLDEPYLGSFDKKMRICKGILDAGKGDLVQISRKNNACFGATWHLGFRRPDEQRMTMIKKFVVEGEKLFSSYKAVDTMASEMGNVPENRYAHFVLGPMEVMTLEPELVVFICNPEAACRLLTLSVFDDGRMPKIKVGGPPCRLAVMYPLLTKEVNVSFYDYTARRQCKVERDQLLVSVPYERIPLIAKSIDACSAGRAKVEFPKEVRSYLQKRIAYRRNKEKGNV